MRRFLALVALAAVLVAACSDESITLVTLPPTPDSGQPVDRTRCVSNSDCPSTAYCGRKDCADIGGICSERPVLCAGAGAPVCGCDGITYWNDCTRRLAGITAQTSDACELETARTCTFDMGHPGGPVTPNTTCPVGTFCARLFPPAGGPDCPVAATGTCWFLPTVCPADSGTERYLRCGGGDSCHTTCDAIRSGDPYQRATTCP